MEDEFSTKSVDLTGELGEEEVGLVSPLVQALQQHFAKYYSSADNPSPFSSKNIVIPPLNLDLINTKFQVEEEE